MTIVLAQPPAAGAAILAKALTDLSRRPGNGMLRAAPSVAKGLPIYGVSLADATSGDVAGKAVRAGWRYLLEGAAGETAFADLRELPDGSLRFSSLTMGPAADRLLQAATVAERAGVSATTDVEPRCLEVPALNLSALWLFGATSEFIPYLDGQGDAGPVAIDPDFLAGVTRGAAAVSTRLASAPSPGDDLGG